MRKYSIIFILCFLGSTVIISQNKVNINIGYGTYLNNSENSMKIMGDSKFRSFASYGITYQMDNIIGCDLLFDYSFNQITKKDVQSFGITGPDSPTILGTFGGDLSLYSHNFDIDFVGIIDQYLSFGIGPSFIIVNRVFEINGSPITNETNHSVYDKLASSGFGVNGFIEYIIPLSNNKNFFYISSNLKLRYTHSIWFDKGLRNLDNYFQEYITTQFSIGVGYSF